MSAHRHSQILASEAATRAFARALGGCLEPGDVILLEGEIGAGKTALARALIQSLQDIPEDVPSPTYTLIQTYQTRRGEIWHADLYRLSGSEEVEELGLLDAFEGAICMVEWPARLGPLTPMSALTLALSADAAQEGARTMTLSWTNDRWTARLAPVLSETAA